MRNLEKDLLKAAKAASTKLNPKTDFTSLLGKDKDEKELRDKLVSKLKEKEIEKMKECGEKLKENSFYYSSDESMEDVSDEAMQVNLETGFGASGKLWIFFICF